MTLGAVLFDMDGVVSDTQRIHSAVESYLFLEYGIRITPDELTQRFAGVSSGELYQAMFAGHSGPKPTLDEFVRLKRERVLMYSRGNIKPMFGAVRLIQELNSRRIPLAIASASQHPYIDLVLSELSLRKAFRVVVSGTDVAHGKPAPDIFLWAAQLLHVAPERCVVIEDGAAGMQAARTAGMKCVGLVTAADTDRYPADLLVSSLDYVSVAMLEFLFS